MLVLVPVLVIEASEEAEAHVDVEAAVLIEDARDGAGLGWRYWGGSGLLSLGIETGTGES